jgi:hypothetical protein
MLELVFLQTDKNHSNKCIQNDTFDDAACVCMVQHTYLIFVVSLLERALTSSFSLGVHPDLVVVRSVDGFTSFGLLQEMTET